MPRKADYTPWALAVTVAIGAALRFATLDVQSYWTDEAYTVALVNLDLTDMWSHIPETESTPPLYYSLAWIWAKVFGAGEVGLRSLSVLFGTATIAVAYYAGSVLRSRRAGLFAAALVAVNPLLVWFSQEARAYSLLVFLSALSFLFFLKVWSSPSRGWAWAWAIASSLAIASHYMGIFLIAAEALLLLLKHRQRRRVIAAFATVVLTGAALLPLAIHQRSVHEQQGKEYAFVGDPLPTRLAQIPKQFVAGYDSLLDKPIAVVIAVALSGALLAALRRGGWKKRHLVLLATGVAAAALVLPTTLAVVGVDYLATPNVMAALVPVLMVAGVGFDAARRGAAVAIGVCLASGLLVVSVTSDENYQREDWRGAAHALGRASVPRALVVSPDVYNPIGEPLRVYVPEIAQMARSGARVREIVILGMAEKPTGEPFVAPRQLTRELGEPGFDLVSRVFDQKFTVLRYRSPVLRRVLPSSLALAHLGKAGDDTLVWLQPREAAASR